jgi:hypothetical protein
MKKKPLVTCGHCHDAIEGTDFVVEFDDARLIHVRCWRVDEPERTSARRVTGARGN